MRSKEMFAVFFALAFLSTIAGSHAQMGGCNPSMGSTVIGASYTVGGGPGNGQFDGWLNCSATGSNGCNFCTYGRLWQYTNLGGGGLNWYVVQGNLPGTQSWSVDCGGSKEVRYTGQAFSVPAGSGTIPGGYSWRYEFDIWTTSNCDPSVGPTFSYTVEFST